MNSKLIVVPDMPELTFEERRHVYLLNGMEIPSVTTLMAPLSDRVYGTVDKETLTKAAGKGTAVHNAIDNYLEFGVDDIPEEYRGYMDSFLGWMEMSKPEIIATERKVYHKLFRYAGTSDLLCMIDGKMTLVDYKTSYQEQPLLHNIQLEGYARAWDSQGVEIEDRLILHLKKDGKYMAHHYPKSAENFEVMKSLNTLYNYMKKF